MILYLHGFRSSPQSFKARMLAQRLHALGYADQYQCPQLPASPREAIAIVERLVCNAKPDSVTLIGSSLGGYYATYLAEQAGYRAVLLNPAVKPPRDLEKYVGVTTAYHSNALFEFKPEYIEELRALAVDKITHPQRYFLIAATGDEVLDWKEMVAQYPEVQQCIIDGSDHGISNFEQYIDQVLSFCGVTTGAGK